MNTPQLGDLKANADMMAARLRLISHPDRLLMICRMDEDEVAVRELVEITGLSQSSVSQHLAMLREEGAVNVRGEAQTRFYSLADPVLRNIIHALCTMCGTVGH